MLKVH